MYDISANNLVSVSLSSGGGFGMSIAFAKEDFAADSSPVKVERATVARSRIDLNKKLVPSRDYRPVRVTLSPIPNTATDNQLKSFLHRARSLASDDENGGNVDKMTIVYKASSGNTLGLGSEQNILTFEDGYTSSGDLGIDVLAEGRYGTPAYVFEFATIKGDFNSVMGLQGKSTGKKKQPKQPKKTMKPGAIFYLGSNSPNNIYQMARW